MLILYINIPTEKDSDSESEEEIPVSKWRKSIKLQGKDIRKISLRKKSLRKASIRIYSLSYIYIYPECEK